MDPLGEPLGEASGEPPAELLPVDPEGEPLVDPEGEPAEPLLGLPELLLGLPELLLGLPELLLIDVEAQPPSVRPAAQSPRTISLATRGVGCRVLLMSPSSLPVEAGLRRTPGRSPRSRRNDLPDSIRGEKPPQSSLLPTRTYLPQTGPCIQCRRGVGGPCRGTAGSKTIGRGSRGAAPGAPARGGGGSEDVVLLRA